MNFAGFYRDLRGFLGNNLIKAVLFDLGETLITFGKVDVVGLFRQGGTKAYEFLKANSQPTGSKSAFLRRHLLIIRLYHLWSMLVGRDFDSSKVLRSQEEKKGVKLSPSQWKEFAWCWYEPLSQLGRIEDSIAKTLSELKSAGLKLGILSNTFIHADSLERHLAQFGLCDYFDIKLYSYEFNYRKPDRRIFADAAQRLELSTDEILFVGDRLDTDVAGAGRANMPVVLKRAYTNQKKKIPQNLPVIETLDQLPGIIAKFNNEKIEV